LHDFHAAALGDIAKVCVSARGWRGMEKGGADAGAAAEAASLERRFAVRRRARAVGAAGDQGGRGRSARQRRVVRRAETEALKRHKVGLGVGLIVVVLVTRGALGDAAMQRCSDTIANARA